ncbi:hypothetical protein EV122DRAFT_290523 [Schizophyllum commune]
MPRLWSKLASADIVRPWLKRANLLDIEIYIALSTTNVPPPTPNICWQRFVLRFDRHFPSMDAPQSISGESICAAQEMPRCSRSSRSAPRTRCIFPSGASFCRAASALSTWRGCAQ